MIGFQNTVLGLTAIVVLAGWCASMDAQAASKATQPQSIIASLAFEKDRVPVGERPRGLVTVKNIGDLVVCVFNGSSTYRFHIEGIDGEPPMTEYNRHLHGDFRPGDGPALMDGPVVCTEIAPPMAGFPGMSKLFKFDLATYYDLSAPGKYAVYIEIYDPLGPRDGSGIWVRSNTAQFEVEAKAR